MRIPTHLLSCVSLVFLSALSACGGGGGGGDGPASGPDLQVTTFTAPSSAAAGSSIPVSDTVTNSGDASAGAFYIGIYLSSNNIISTQDTFLTAFRDLGGLAPGASSTGSGNTTLPSNLAAGTYYIGAIADDLNEVSESNEANNVSTVRTITITAGAADLVVNSFTAPGSGTAGSGITVSSTTKNNGSGSAGASSTGIYLSTDSAVTTGDTLLGTISVASLAAGATGAGSTTVTLPASLTAGTYYLGAVADYAGAVSESSETNNVSSVVTITVAAVSTAPDLVESSFSAPSSGTAGSSITVSDTVTNNGNAAAAAFEVGLYLSTNSAITTADTLIATRNVTSLAAGASSPSSGSVTLPASLAAGTYYLGVIADDLNAVAESNETNNVSNVVTITIGAATTAPDLRESSFTAPSSGTAGGSITIGDTVTNSGTAAAGDFYVGIYLSTNNVISTADTAIAWRYVTGLAAGASSSASGSVTLPSGLAAGTYYLGAIADDLNAVSESNETNNVSSVATISIAAGTSCTADSYEPDDNAASAKTISLGLSQSRNFCDDASDWLKFTAVAGSSYTIETTVIGANADTVVDLYSTNGTTLLATDDDSGVGFASRLTWVAPSSGTYYVNVRSWGGSTGTGQEYSVRLTSP